MTHQPANSSTQASVLSVYGPGEDSRRWPREIVVEHDDGTVSLLADLAIVGGNIRCRRADDVVRKPA